MPYKTALGVNYDCGEFAATWRPRWSKPTYAGFPARRERRRPSAASCAASASAIAIERAAGPVPEFAEIRFDPSGTATLLMGTKNQGQGHETTFKQILHEQLGIEPGEVQFIDGDTDRVAFGMGSNGSRSTVIGGTALTHRGREGDRQGQEDRGPSAGGGRGRPRVRRRAVHRRRHRPRRHPQAGGARRLSGRRGCRPGSKPGFTKPAPSRPKHDTFPNGCHVCEVEIDPRRAASSASTITVVDDVGTVINPRRSRARSMAASRRGWARC